MNIFRTTVPLQRFNNDLILDQDQWDTFHKHKYFFDNHTYAHKDIEGSSNDFPTLFYAEFLQRSFVYVVSETVGEYPYPYFSEKTWKAINTGMPFMMINAQYSLTKLKDFGFRTFDDWWDETYDNLTTVADRIDAVVKNLQTLSTLSTKELQSIKLEMLPILEHNQKQLTVLKATDLQNIANLI